MLGTQAQAASRSALPALRAGWLPGRDVEVIEQVGRGDPQEQPCHFSLVKIGCRLVPDGIGNRIRAVSQARHGLGER